MAPGGAAFPAPPTTTSTPALQEGESLPGTGDPVLFTSLGGDERIRSKALYFLRATGAKGVPDFDGRDGAELLSGELTPDVLASLQAQMLEVYQPAFLRREDAAEWGKAEAPQVGAFKASLQAFTEEMHETMESLDERVQLQFPNEGLDLEAAARDVTRPARLSADTIRQFEALLESWCSTIEGVVGDREKANTLAALADQVPHTAGPRGITSYWRTRMQKLTSITEQLKGREFKVVISVMTALVGKSGQAPVDASRSGAFLLLRRWKTVDVALTEAANEAKDNVKYLSTLTKFIDPLYQATPLEVIDGESRAARRPVQAPPPTPAPRLPSRSPPRAPQLAQDGAHDRALLQHPRAHDGPLHQDHAPGAAPLTLAVCACPPATPAPPPRADDHERQGVRLCDARPWRGSDRR